MRRGVALLWLAVWMTAAARVMAAESLLLTGATVHTVGGETFAPGQVLISGGKIAEVGRTVTGTAAQTVDLAGQHLYPGMIALNTLLGLIEINAVRATQDSSEVGDYTPDVESWIAVNPDSELIPVARANGVAFFEPVPQGGIVSGQSGLVSVEGWTTEQRTFKKPIALHLFWPSMELSIRERGRAKGKAKSIEEQGKERRTKLRATEDFFDEARAYAKAKAAAPRERTNVWEVIPAWEAMLPYVDGSLPIMVHADELRAIKAAVQWAAANRYRIIIAGGRDAWMAASLLASNNVPVVYGDVFTLPLRDHDPYDIHFKAPEILRKAGVQVALSTEATGHDAGLVRNLPYIAAQAVAFGLPEVEALKAITLTPARLAGVADRLGSIERGKEATLFSADGNILDIRANVKHLWIAGKEIPLDSRHTRLYQKYKERPKEATR